MEILCLGIVKKKNEKENFMAVLSKKIFLFWVFLYMENFVQKIIK